jgi:prefoldin subunit 5
VDQELTNLQSRLNGYRMVESRLQQERLRLSSKMPDIARSLDQVHLLLEKKEAQEPVTLDFEVTDHVYAKAKIDNPQSVLLWLGANVMLEYSLEEAKELLSGQRDKASGMLEDAREKGTWLKNQMTTAEVLTARIYNYDIQKKKAEAEAGK